MKLFKNHYKPNTLYLLKKNIQRKEGILLTKSYNEILENSNKGYRVIQKYVPNLFLIDKRKINLRLYLLVTCKNNKVS